MDKEIEHDNLAFKTDIHSFKGEITDRSIARVSHSTGATNEILPMTIPLTYESHRENTQKCPLKMMS